MSLRCTGDTIAATATIADIIIGFNITDRVFTLRRHGFTSVTDPIAISTVMAAGFTVTGIGADIITKMAKLV